MMERPDSSLGGKWADQIKAKPVTWIWPYRIPAGMLTVIDGRPGVGKSTLLAELIAHVTTGNPWPDGTPCDSVGRVLLCSGEDDPARTIRPRLEAAGADTSKVQIIEPLSPPDEFTVKLLPAFALPGDMRPLMRDVVGSPKAKLVILDPFEVFLEDKLTPQRVRELVAGLATLALNTGVAIILVRHPRKAGGSAINVGLGPIAIAAQARAVYLVARKRGDDKVSVLASTKFNIGPRPSSLSYRLVESTGTGAPRVEWLGEIDITADQLLMKPRPSPRLEAAKAFLREILADEPMPASDVTEAAKAEGITPKTLRSAREQLEVFGFKQGFEGPWLWRLPEHDPDHEDDGQDRAAMAAEPHFDAETTSEPVPDASSTEDSQQESEIDRLAANDAFNDEVEGFFGEAPSEEDFKAANALFHDVAHEHDGQDRETTTDDGQDRGPDSPAAADLRHCSRCGSEFPARFISNDYVCPVCGEEPF
jgi:AAA domain-containing protein